MSDIEVQALEANFEGWKKDRASSQTSKNAFERFANELILKDYDLSDEELDFGHLGGSDDGGIDGMYFFIGRTLIQDETESPVDASSATLILTQAKYESGFGETAIEKLTSFTRDLLDYSTPPDQFIHLNSFVRDAINRFREKYGEIIGSPHVLNIRYYYVTKSDVPPNAKVKARAQILSDFVKGKLSAAIIGFEYWGASKLLDVVRSAPELRLKLKYTEYFNTDDESTVSLVNLKSFADALKDDTGQLRRSLLEPNVRAYQGPKNPVNEAIQDTLKEDEPGIEFWWLNNGITIVANSCTIAGKHLVIEGPEIVNGLQTTQEIFNYFAKNADHGDERNVLVRIIVPPNEKARNDIIKATNNQTPVNPLSLHATEPLHFDIEDRLKLHDIFYDRRKGNYRNLRKQISQIVSQKEVAKTVMAIALQQPDDARGRPESLTNDEKKYPKVFNARWNRDAFVACVLLDRQIQKYLSPKTGIAKDEKRDLRYYLGMMTAATLASTAHPTPAQIAEMVPTIVAGVDDQVLDGQCDLVLNEYRTLVEDLKAKGTANPNDKVGKGTGLRAALLEILDQRYPSSDHSHEKITAT